MFTREEATKKLEWVSGGYGMPDVAGSMIWATSRPSDTQPDLVSVVAVYGPPENYTNEELNKLAIFSEEATQRYDKMFKWRLGANLILFKKEETGRWLRKRLTWDRGPMHSESLDEALEHMKPKSE